MTRLHAIRSGSIHVAWTLFLASGALLAVLVGLLYWMGKSEQADHPRRPLLIYCAAGIREPVEAAAREYEKTYGVPIELQYGGSQSLLASLELSKQGDLYVPADDYYIHLAQKRSLIHETIPVAQMTPVLAVPKGNPKKIETLDQLLTGKLRIAQVNSDAGAIGKVTRDALEAVGQWQALKEKTTVFTPNVQEVLAALKLGSVDAGIVWDALVRQNPNLEAVVLPQLAAKKSLVSISVLSSCNQPTAALRFARYLGAQDKGLKEMERCGFTPVAGDDWAEKPELRFFGGAMLRPAIEETITAFEKREGVEVVRVYNGCGILVAQMRGGAHADAYFACEKSFMKQVNDLFLDAVDVSSNQLVIVVHKGNPHGVKTLKDLGQSGLRVGVGHEQQCALGAITEQTLKQGGFHTEVMKNVAARSPTGDMLVNQLRTGSLDAVIAYISNTAGQTDIEAFTIEGIPCAVAIQPIAVAKECKQKHLAGRLLDDIRSQTSRQRFESYGFGWKDGQ